MGEAKITFALLRRINIAYFSCYVNLMLDNSLTYLKVLTTKNMGFALKKKVLGQKCLNGITNLFVR